MTRTTSTNFTGANSFPKANAADDLFLRADIQDLAAAVDAHNHTMGKGVVISAGTFRGVRATRSTNQSTNNNTDTAISFTGVTFDTASYWSAGSPTRLTVPSGGAGYYQITGACNWAYNSTGDRWLHIRYNGTTDIAAMVVGHSNGFNSDMQATTVYHLAVGDYVEALGLQNSGVSLNLAAGGLLLAFLGT